MNGNPTIQEIVEYNLDKIPKDKFIKVKSEDFMYIYRTLEEFMRFFHQPEHYKEIDDIKNFLGTQSSGGAFEVLNITIYKKLYNIELPKEIKEMMDNGDFEHILSPDYYKNAISKG
jgi:hypothetical protein